MQQLYPDLWQTKIHRTSMVNSHAYLLTRPRGNILFYNTADAQDLSHIDQLGGVKYQLLTHRDEAGHSLQRIRDRFDTQLMFSQLEADAIAPYAQANAHFSEQDSLLEDVQVIATAGHTDGSLCFAYTSPYGKKYLFTGDTLFLWQGLWKTFVLKHAGGSHKALLNSLSKLLDVYPDVVLSSGFIGETGVGEMAKEQWKEVISQQIQQLEVATSN